MTNLRIVGRDGQYRVVDLDGPEPLHPDDRIVAADGEPLGVGDPTAPSSWSWATPELRTGAPAQLLEYIEAAMGLICNAHSARIVAGQDPYDAAREIQAAVNRAHDRLAQAMPNSATEEPR